MSRFSFCLAQSGLGSPRFLARSTISLGWHAYRIKMERMPDDELVRLVTLHGDKAAELLRTSVVCPNFRRYEAVMQRAQAAARPDATPRQIDLFDRHGWGQ